MGHRRLQIMVLMVMFYYFSITIEIRFSGLGTI